MGYTTDFEGRLDFEHNATAKELSHLSTMLGKDRRDLGYSDDSIYENGRFGNHWYHIDYKLTEDFLGIEWNGMEKSCEMERIVNWLTVQMRKEYPEFMLSGEMLAQGEDRDDRWRLVMHSGVALKTLFPRVGDRITCPCCEQEFTLEEPNQSS